MLVGFHPAVEDAEVVIGCDKGDLARDAQSSCIAAFAAETRIHKKIVSPIMEAKEKDKMLYTSPDWESLIANIILQKF